MTFYVLYGILYLYCLAHCLVFNTLCFVVSRTTVSAVFCLVVPAVFDTLYHLYVLCKLNDDDE